MTRNTWLFLVFAAMLAVALPGAASTAGCCQFSDSCEKTDNADACKAQNGFHYQLAYCDGKTCHPTAADPTDPVSPAGVTKAVCPAWLAGAPEPGPAAPIRNTR